MMLNNKEGKAFVRSSILKIKTATNTWTFVTDILNICLYNTQCNKYTFHHQICSLLFRNVLQIRTKDMFIETWNQNISGRSKWFSYHPIEILWVFVGTIWSSSLWSKRRVGSRPEASPQLSYSHKLGLKSWKTYFHILKSAFSYFIFWQTQFETSFRLSIFIGDINFSIRWLMNWLVGIHPRQPNG